MYTTKDAIKMLENNKLGLVLHLEDNPNIHISKTIKNEIYIGEYGNGKVRNFIDYEEVYTKSIWKINFRGSKIIK